jgi:hypothetical protein
MRNTRRHDEDCPEYGCLCPPGKPSTDFAVSRQHGECQCELIARIRPKKETTQETELTTKAVIAEKICGSEPFMWLMNGSNHVDSQISELRPLYLKYLAEGGGWGKANQPKKGHGK